MAGPNGSGKTTLTQELIKNKIPLGQYLNPDNIAKHLNLKEISKDHRVVANKSTRDISYWPKHEIESLATLIAQKVVTGLRDDWCQDSLSLTYESVMSHPSHVEYAKKAKNKGFDVYLYYICTSSVDLNIERVAQRVEAGGHKVPLNKIKERYTKSLLQVPSILEQCHRAYFFDNSYQKFMHFAEVTPDGFLDIDDKKFTQLKPEWFIEHVLKKWNKDKVRPASW